jgi:2-polyprenyl-6-methoxyphenol hydroxylase-like FAD-dependent oxidoreductase
MIAPVLIIGAGPVGLALAGDLAWRGVPSCVIERGDGTIQQPRMDLVGVRTMEFCRRWGLVGAVESSPYNRNLGQDNIYVTSLCGYELGRERFPSMNAALAPAQSPQRRERCPQDMFDPILRRWVASFPNVTMRYRCELVDLRQSDSGIEARVLDRTTGRSETLAAQYLIGCDGASSTTARLSNIGFHGAGTLTTTTNVVLRAPSLRELHDKGDAYRFIVLSPEAGTWATLVAIDGWGRYRMSIVRAPAEGLDTAAIGAAVRRVVGAELDYTIESVSHWKRRELVAETYRRGRAFLAGDAAHVMSPTGGFGMNTGIGDAVDLAWKLDALLAGWGGATLLDAYTSERRPVAQRNALEASANLERMLSPGPQPLLLDPGPEGDAFRLRFGAEFSAIMRREWYTLGIHLGYRYDASPICWNDHAPRPPLEVARYDQSTLPGARAPHVWLQRDRSTLDLFGRGFTLVRAGPHERVDALVAAAAARAVPLAVATLAQQQAQAAYAPGLVLVRPDGHVAWRDAAAPADPGAVIDCVRGVAPYAWRRSDGG